MPFDAIESAELLGAYLSGDVAQEERTAVEQLLADDVIARELLDELREFSAYLKAGDTIASPEALEALRRIVQQKIEEKRIKTLVAVSVTGDLTASEKDEVQAYLNSHPAAAAAQRQASAMSLLLDSGQRAANDALADKLRLRMQSLLPAGAMSAPGVIVPKPLNAPAQNVKLEIVKPVASTNAVTPSTQSAREQLRPSLRVFVKAESPWKKRALALSSLAALIALAVGARAMWSRGTKELAVNPTVDIAPDKAPKHAIENDTHTEIVKPTPGQNNVVPREILPPNERKQDAIVRSNPNGATIPPKPPVEEPNNNIVVPRNPDVPKTPEAIVKTDVDTKPAPTPVTPNINSAVVKKDEVVNPNPVAPNDTPKESVATTKDTPKNNPTPTVQPNNVITGNVSPSGTNNVASGGPNTAAISPTPTPAPPAPVTPNPTIAPTAVGTKIPPQDGMGVVGKLKGAGIAKVTATDGEVSTLMATGDTVPSGATLETGDVRIGLVLPGNGRLYVDRLSSVTVTFTGTNTKIQIKSGEFYYIAPNSGTLTVVADKATVSKVQEGDINVTPSKLTVLNFGNSPLDLGAAKQNTIRLPNNFQGSVATDGSAAPKRDPANTLTGAWRVDALVDGDGVRALGKRR